MEWENVDALRTMDVDRNIVAMILPTIGDDGSFAFYVWNDATGCMIATGNDDCLETACERALSAAKGQS